MRNDENAAVPAEQGRDQEPNRLSLSRTGRAPDEVNVATARGVTGTIMWPQPVSLKA